MLTITTVTIPLSKIQNHFVKKQSPVVMPAAYAATIVHHNTTQLINVLLLRLLLGPFHERPQI
jgi:hypothetical protein